MTNVAIGIDIGGTNTSIGFVDIKGNCLYKTAIPTNTKQGPESYVAEVSGRIKDILLVEKDFAVKGIGIGAPNGNYNNGTIEFAPNLDFEGVVPLVETMKKHFDIPVFLTNDANAAAMGEMIYGGAKDMKDFIMMTLGTGVGSGIVVNGEMVYGSDGFAGELGHVIVIPEGRQCNCGRKGCLETYCSAGGMVRTAFELLSTSNKESTLRNYSFNDLDSKAIYDEARKGDQLAIEIFRTTGEILGKALADFVTFSSPEAIFLFGGPMNSGDLLLNPIKEYFEASLLKIFKNKIKILPSQLRIGDAAIVGASALVWKEISL